LHEKITTFEPSFTRLHKLIVNVLSIYSSFTLVNAQIVVHEVIKSTTKSTLTVVAYKLCIIRSLDGVKLYGCMNIILSTHTYMFIYSVSTTHHMQAQTHNLQFSWRQLLCVLEESVSLVNYLNVSIDILFLGQSPAQKKNSYAIWNTKPLDSVQSQEHRNKSNPVQK